MNLLFNHTMTLPNGVVGTHHRIVRMELSPTLEQAHLSITTWPDEQARLDGHEAVWMEMVVVDVEALDLSEGLLSGLLAAVLAQPAYAGGTAVPDASETLEAAKARRTAEIKARRDLLEFGLVESGGLVFDGDAAAQRRITGATAAALIARQMWLVAAVQALASATATALPAEPEIEEVWTLADNSVTDLDESGILGLAADVIGQVSNAHAVCRLVLTEVAAATTVEEVAAVELPALP